MTRTGGHNTIIFSKIYRKIDDIRADISANLEDIWLPTLIYLTETIGDNGGDSPTKDFKGLKMQWFLRNAT